MIHLRRRIYRLVLRLHPAAFREEFGFDMAMDFEDALRDRRAAGFYRDALLSLGRQWMVRGLGAETAPQTAAGPCLLSGRYGMIDADRLKPFELFRGLIVSVALVAVFLLAPTRTARSSRSPANPVGMRGSVPGGTGAMQRGGDDDQTAGQKKLYEQTVLEPRAASGAEITGAPANVAATTAAVLSGVPWPGQAGSGSGMVLVAKRPFTEFDVASVRENRSGGEVSMNIPLGPTDAYTKTGGVFRVTNLSLPGYIAFAYKLNTYQNTKMRIQVPEWARTTHYDIEARVDGEPTKDDMRAMMRALLADRFNLKVHTETHEMGVMDLEMIKPGKTGPTLVVHNADDPECKQNVPKFFSPCGAMGITPATTVAKMAGRNVTLRDFAEFSLIPAGKPVVDKTGLTGRWDITLDFVQDSPGRTADAPPEETGPTFLEALKQQMGLKMVPSQGMVDTVVLDRVERPTEN